MKRIFALAAASALTASMLAACSDPEPKTPTGNSDGDTAASETVDIDAIEAVDEIAALVPDAVKDRGILRNGASTDYPPGEFRADDGQTPVGYDIDIVRALAKVMGLEDGETQHAEFPTIIPALGSKFDIGASSFTITDERLEAVHMVSYVEVGSSYAVVKDNPAMFDPENPCGATIGVQSGTYQHDYAKELSAQCEADGKKPIEVMPHKLNSDAVTKLIGKQYDAVLSDSTVTGYAITQTDGQLEQVGEVIESAPQGIAIAKADTELAEAVQKAMQHLMDEGILHDILAQYGAQDAALDEAKLN